MGVGKGRGKGQEGVESMQTVSMESGSEPIDADSLSVASS